MFCIQIIICVKMSMCVCVCAHIVHTTLAFVYVHTCGKISADIEHLVKAKQNLTVMCIIILEEGHCFVHHTYSFSMI